MTTIEANKICNPISDIGRIKDSLCSLFLITDDITRLVMPSPDEDTLTETENWYKYHCFDIPYMKGSISGCKAAIFVETQISQVPSKYLKEMCVNISIMSHKDFVKLSDSDKTYYNSIGIYGNRVDCICQSVNSLLLTPTVAKSINENFSIGDMRLINENPIAVNIDGSEFYGKTISYSYQSHYQTRKNVK